MGTPEDLHLSRISTIWTQVLDAHGDDEQAVRAAQTAVMDRYSASVYRYLQKVLGDSDAADEVFQQFALQFVRQAFRHANPQRGRFRDYVKISVLNLVSRYRRGQAMAPRPVNLEHFEDQLAAEANAEDDAEFNAIVQEGFLMRAWSRLEAMEKASGTPVYSVLQLRTQAPQAKSPALAEMLQERYPNAKPFTAEHARKLLQRARQHFTDILVDEVSQTLHNPTPEDLLDELQELGLLAYCRGRLRR